MIIYSRNNNKRVAQVQPFRRELGISHVSCLQYFQATSSPEDP